MGNAWLVGRGKLVSRSSFCSFAPIQKLLRDRLPQKKLFLFSFLGVVVVMVLGKLLIILILRVNISGSKYKVKLIFEDNSELAGEVDLMVS